MNKYSETFGIDIGKDFLDCYGGIQGHLPTVKQVSRSFKNYSLTIVW